MEAVGISDGDNDRGSNVRDEATMLGVHTGDTVGQSQQWWRFNQLS